MTADHLQAIFWSITYIFLIVYALKYKIHGIPLVAICLNFAWETAAVGALLIYGGEFSVAMLIRGAWLLLDCAIVGLYCFYETKFFENWKEKVIFFSAHILSTICLAVLFFYGYMLISCFVIDLIMAVAFVRYIAFRKLNAGWMEYAIGFAKLLGDLFAWIFYRNVTIVDYIGVCVLVCNICYMIIITVKLKKQKKQTGGTDVNLLEFS